MAIDTRDYYIEKLRKRTRYVERAAFRMSEKDKTRARIRRAWLRIALVLLLATCAVLIKRFLMR